MFTCEILVQYGNHKSQVFSDIPTFLKFCARPKYRNVVGRVYLINQLNGWFELPENVMSDFAPIFDAISFVTSNE